MTKREELMSCQMSAFKDFIMQKRRDIADCSFEVENDVVSMAGSWGDNGPYINLPTGVKEAKIKILFGSPCSEDKQEIIETFIIEIKKFVITFNMDSYALIEIDYERVEVNEEN